MFKTSAMPGVLAVMAFCLFAGQPADAAQRGPLVVAVCPTELAAGLQGWIEYRTFQGYRIQTITPRPTAEATHAVILEMARTEKIEAVVLVGDVQVPHPSGLTRALTPTFYRRAKVNVQWGSEPWIATDAPYGDLDGDEIPDVSVGRLPADTSQQLSAMIAKTRDYELNQDFGTWRRRLHLVAGMGGFGVLSDMAVETAAKALVTNNIPGSYEVSVTNASFRSPFFPDPRQFRQTTIERLNEGSLFWIYMGHGHRHTLDRVTMQNQAFPILEQSDIPRLNCRSGSPIAVLLACYTGAYDHRDDCMAEAMVLQPGGPVAVLSGSRVTMPYGMGVLALAALEGAFEERTPTAGELLLYAKRKTMAEPKNNVGRSLLDTVGGLLNPSDTTLEDERREHIYLINLLGDPLLRIAYPEPADVLVEKNAQPGAAIDLAVRTPIAGEATLELALRRDRLPSDLGERAKASDPLTWQRYQQAYARANDRRIATTSFQVQPGVQHLRLQVPAGVQGACYLRLHVRGTASSAVGCADIVVQDAAEATKVPVTAERAGERVGAASATTPRR